EYAQAFNNRGVARQALGDLAGAIDDFDTALRCAPNYADALNNRGLARLAQGDFPGAKEDYDRALQSVPHAAAVPIYHNRGAARQTVGDHAGALEDFDAAVRINPNHAPHTTIAAVPGVRWVIWKAPWPTSTRRLP